MTWISNTLKNLQNTVDGHIEVTRIGDKGLLMLCNEDGKNLCLEKNFMMGFAPFQDMIVGTVVLCGSGGEDFADVPIDMKQWKAILKLWGNEV